jgi:uncharacterized iron-regulated membrane protein
MNAILIMVSLFSLVGLYCWSHRRLAARRDAIAYADFADKAWYAGFSGESYPFLDRVDLNLVAHFEFYDHYQNGQQYLNDYKQHCKELR